jgi:effector-binding domain-containing protein
MIESPHIVETQSQSAAVIHLAIPREEMRKAMPLAIQEVKAAIARQGITAEGPLIIHHLKLSPKKFDFEVGYPVSAPVSSMGRVKAGTLPAAKVARTVYHGDYEGLFAAWDEFGKRLQSQGILAREGLTSAATLWEAYLVGPETSSDPRDWQTELNLPLVKSFAS